MQERVWHRFYDEGVPNDLVFEDATVIDYFEQSVREHPDAIAIVFLNRKISYRELKDHVDRLATALRTETAWLPFRTPEV